jgi:hypothetical protein
MVNTIRKFKKLIDDCGTKHFLQGVNNHYEINKGVRVMNQFKRWITAEPSKNHSFIRSIPLKLLTGTLLLYIGYMFIAGTGAVFASATPYGFKTRQIGNNIIHFEKTFEKDIQTYFSDFSQARLKNDLLWNQGDIDVLSKEPVIHLYLCSSNSKACQLSSMGTPAVNIFGNKIVLSKEFVDESNWDIVSVLSHEISHVNAAMRYGWIKGYFNWPLWLDEGIASVQSNFWQNTPENFKKLLEMDPHVTSISKLNSLVAWNNGFSLGHDNFLKQYCYSEIVAADIIKKRGFDTIKRFFRGDITESELLGSDIHTYEKKLLASSVLKHTGIQLQYPDVSFNVKLLWTMQFIIPLLVMVYLLMWLTRQGFKICRVSGLVRKIGVVA